jgi:hypothetical protein
MPLQRIEACPSCGASMCMQKQNGAFTCPVCGCSFEHNWKAWFVGIPLAGLVAYGVFLVIHIGLPAAAVGGIVSLILVSRMGLYRILAEGKRDVAEEDVQAYQPEIKESKWFIALLALLLLAIAAGAFFL